MIVNGYVFDFDDNMAFTRIFIDQIAAIVVRTVPAVRVREASKDEDTKRGTDLVLSADPVAISVRMRRAGTKYRDVTIRVRSEYGLKTEYHKCLCDGHGDFFFYGWESDARAGVIGDWVLLSWPAIRRNWWRDPDIQGLFKNPIHNRGDKTAFVPLPLERMTADVVVASSFSIDWAPQQNELFRG